MVKIFLRRIATLVRSAKLSDDPVEAGRQSLNREIIRLSLANLGLLLLWGLLAFQHAEIAQRAQAEGFDATYQGLLIGAAVLTVAVWGALLVSLTRRLIYWSRHERD